MCNKCTKRIHGKKPDIAGLQFGIEFSDLPYTKDGKTFRNPQFELLSEDDEFWHQTGLSASVHWLRDLRRVIDRAIDVAENTGLMDAES